MSRFKTTLDTVLRTIIVTDTETESKLHIKQNQSTDDWGKLELLDEEDQLVSYANDLQDDLNNAQLALMLYGDSFITFDDNNFPSLYGGVKLHNVKVHNPNFRDVDLRNFEAICCDQLVVVSTTAENVEWPHGSLLRLSHCFISDKYSDVRERMSMQLNEWFLNQRVDGELW